MSNIVIIDGKPVSTSSNEYANKYKNLANINGSGEYSRTLQEVTATPRNNLNLVASVHKGQNEFGKKYAMPVMKMLGSMNPATAIPMAGMELYSAYSMPESESYGNKRQAWLNAGLEMLPVVGAGATKIVGKALDKIDLIRAFSDASKKFDGTVGESYFSAPDKWYRITETPEVEGIKELGRNMTTSDLLNVKNLNVDNFRRAIIDNKLKAVDGGWAVDKQKRKILLTKSGSAHGNTSQAALGEKWRGSVASSGLFPDVVLEGQRMNTVGASFDPIKKVHLDRRSFINQPWDDLPIGTRLGFKTGEMPMENLKAFQKLPNGRYSFSDVIPDKRINAPEYSSQVVPTKTNAF